MSLISASPPLWLSGAQGLVVGAVPHGARDSEGLERHGEDLAVCLFQRATADLLWGGERPSLNATWWGRTCVWQTVSNSVLYALFCLVASRTADWSSSQPQQEQGESCRGFLWDVQRSCSLHLHAGCPQLVSSHFIKISHFFVFLALTWGRGFARCRTC